MADGTLKVGTITTSSGSGTITLGQSGETLSVPSGATITNSGTATGFGGVNTPAFQATLSSDQTVNQNTSTIVAFNTEAYDTDSAYNTSDYKFTPQTAGKYFCYSVLHLGMANDKKFFWNTTFWKNGSQSNGSLISQVSAKEGFDYYSVVSHDVVTLNGSSDYIQLRTIFYDYTSGGNYNLRGNNSDGRKFNMFGAYKLIGV
jgi:hypothetical protein